MNVGTHGLPIDCSVVGIFRGQNKDRSTQLVALTLAPLDPSCRWRWKIGFQAKLRTSFKELSWHPLWLREKYQTANQKTSMMRSASVHLKVWLYLGLSDGKDGWHLTSVSGQASGAVYHLACSSGLKCIQINFVSSLLHQTGWGQIKTPTTLLCAPWFLHDDAAERHNKSAQVKAGKVLSARVANGPFDKILKFLSVRKQSNSSN